MSGPEAATKTKRRHSRRRPLPVVYRKAIMATVREHRKAFSALFLADPTMKERGAKLYRSLLPPIRRPGRPKSDRVTKAIELRKQGMDWPQICERVIPHYRELPLDSQQRLSDRLQHAVRFRLRGRKSRRKASR